MQLEFRQSASLQVTGVSTVLQCLVATSHSPVPNFSPRPSIPATAIRLAMILVAVWRAWNRSIVGAGTPVHVSLGAHYQ